MLYIDPDLHNPKVNGIPLMVGDRINPEIAINKDDLVAAEGIIIDKFSDGTIRISADISGASTGEGDKYINIWDIDFMSTLPSVLFRFLNALFDGLEAEVFFYRDHSISKTRRDFVPSYFCQFDVSGDAASYPEEETFGEINVTAELKGINYSDADSGFLGQGVLISMNNNGNYLYSVLIASDSGFTTILKSITTSKNKVFVSFNDYASGTYYWYVRATDKQTITKSDPESGSFNFTWQEPPYTTNCCPRNLTGPTQDFTISYSGGDWYAYDDNWENCASQQLLWIFFSSNYGGYYDPSMSGPSTIVWSRADGKKMLASSSVTLTFDTALNGACNCYLEGPDNGTDWTVIQNLIPSSYWTDVHNFTINNVTPYTYLRIRTGQGDYGNWNSLKKIEVY